MLIVIDGNSTGNAHHHANTLTYGGMQTQAVFGMVRAVRELRTSLPQASILCLWDGRAQKRFELYPQYKANRDEAERADPEKAASRAAYRAQVPIIRKALELLGVRQWLHPHQEADDLAGYICKITPGKTKTLLTGDTDWLQLVDENTVWVDARGDGKRITHADFFECTGFHSPGEYIEGKMLQGDTSDGIGGIPNFGEKTAANFMARWRTVEDFFNAVDGGSYTPATRKSKTAKSPHPEATLASPEGRALFRRNFALMDLRACDDIKPGDIRVTSAAPDFDKFRTLCDRLGFVSITRDFHNWVAPFDVPRAIPLAA